MAISPKFLTHTGLVNAFYDSYSDGSAYDTRECAQEVMNRQSELEGNWPVVVEDAQDELSIPA